MKKFQKWNTLNVDKLIRVNEAVAVDKYLKAVKLVSNLISRRISQKIYVSPLAQTVQKSGGDKLSGVYGVFGDKQIRYNWKISGSADIVSVDIWNKIKPNPDITVELNDIPLVKCVDIIAQSIIQGKPIGDQVLEERVQPKTGGKVSQNIADAIKQWAIDMDVDDGKLEKTRISHLFNDFEYWRLEVTENDFKPISKASFRNYIVEYINNSGLKNIFMRVVTSSKAKGEKVVVDAVDEKKFSNILTFMDLDDQKELASASVMSVFRGYTVCQIIAGLAGVGKTTLIDKLLKDGKGTFFKKLASIKGGISNPLSLYEFFYKNRSKDTLIYIEDSDVVFTKKYLDLMKNATDTKKVRTITWLDSKKLKKGTPEEFKFEARFIIVTNLQKTKIDPALYRRGNPIFISGTLQDVADDIRRNLDDVMKEYVEATYDIKKEVLDFLESVLSNVNQLNFSLFKQCCIFKLSGSPKWKKYSLAILKNSM